MSASSERSAQTDPHVRVRSAGGRMKRKTDENFEEPGMVLMDIGAD